MDIQISQAAIDLIIDAEVTGEATYNKLYQHPTWPEGDSGVTVGIGYDLGQSKAADIEKDWTVDGVTSDTLHLLVQCAGITGQNAKNFLPNVKAAIVPFDAAMHVFINKDIPRSFRQALHAYPGLDQLTPNAIGAIVSLVYNRGAALQGHNREGMAALVPLIANKDYAGIASTIDGMKTLWPSTSGLYIRRINEAKLVLNPVNEPVVTITI